MMQYRDQNIKHNISNDRLFGSYFVEAGLVRTKQIKAILIEQKTKYPHKKNRRNFSRSRLTTTKYY